MLASYHGICDRAHGTEQRGNSKNHCVDCVFWHSFEIVSMECGVHPTHLSTDCYCMTRHKGLHIGTVAWMYRNTRDVLHILRCCEVEEAEAAKTVSEPDVHSDFPRTTPLSAQHGAGQPTSPQRIQH